MSSGQKVSLSIIFPVNQVLLTLFKFVNNLEVHTKILSLFVRQSFVTHKQIIVKKKKKGVCSYDIKLLKSDQNVLFASLIPKLKIQEKKRE